MAQEMMKKQTTMEDPQLNSSMEDLLTSIEMSTYNHSLQVKQFVEELEEELIDLLNEKKIIGEKILNIPDTNPIKEELESRYLMLCRLIASHRMSLSLASKDVILPE